MTFKENHLVYTYNLANFINQLTYDNLSQRVVDETKRAVLDILGCVLGGSKEPEIKMVEELIQDIDKKRMATMIARKRKASPLNAAFINACMGEILMLNDGHNRAKNSCRSCGNSHCISCC